MQGLQQLNQTVASSEALTTGVLDRAAERMTRGYDETHGGFGRAPKFPMSVNLDFLLRSYKRTGAPDYLRIVEHTARRMAQGGMYDQLGGGFHRYSTDTAWLAPHFEKMLYDNALLARFYLHVYLATGNGFYRRITEETLDYVVREMTDAQGGFYSTQDADSEGVEGKFFVWSPGEIEAALAPYDARLFALYYDVTPQGNFEGHNILHVTRSVEETAHAAGVTTEELSLVLERGRKKLFDLRERRVKPGRDEKILASWNGLMLRAFAEAAVVLRREDYREVAERNASFITKNMKDGASNLLLHSKRVFGN